MLRDQGTPEGNMLALALDGAVGRIERRLMKWQPKSGETEWDRPLQLKPSAVRNDAHGLLMLACVRHLHQDSPDTVVIDSIAHETG